MVKLHAGWCRHPQRASRGRTRPLDAAVPCKEKEGFQNYVPKLSCVSLRTTYSWTEELSVWSWMTAMTLVRFCACFTNHLTELYSITSLLGQGKDLEKREAGKTDYLMWQKIFQVFFFWYLHHNCEKGWKLYRKRLRTRLGQVCSCCFSLLLIPGF